MDVSVNNELMILVTEADKHGTDIAAMSDFFDGYIKLLSSSVGKSKVIDKISDIPMADIGTISEVLRFAGAVAKGDHSFVADLDSLPSEVKEKLKKGIYKIGESKQVDGNLRAVIMDENNVRVKDVTLKQVQNDLGTMDMVRNISNQAQMRQIYAKLESIEDLQLFQIERDRDRDIVTPFLNARDSLLAAQESTDETERREKIKEANRYLTSSINAIYTDIRTTSNHLVKLTNRSFFQKRKQINQYMTYLAGDLQLATKFTGLQMQVYERIGDNSGSLRVWQNYRHAMEDFVNAKIDDKGQTACSLLQMNYPYTKDNKDFWYNFSREITPVIDTKEVKDCCEKIYLVSVEE